MDMNLTNWFLVISRIFFFGGCYGLIRTDDLMLQAIGVFFAISLFFDILYQFRVVDEK